MSRKTSKRSKSQIKQYTAFVPKTMKATKTAGNTIMKKINYFFTNTTKTLKRRAKMLDKQTAKTIGSLTRRQTRR
jgi:hypothetical protein